jgi:putative MATE family efflux protein
MISTTPPRRVSAILEGQETEASRESITRALERTIRRRVVEMGVPSTASFLLLTIYDLVDIFWLAKIGEEPVAAVTMFMSLLWVLSFPNNIVGSGSVAVISRRFGEGDAIRTEISIKNTFLSKLTIGIVVGTIGILTLPWALDFLGAEPRVRELALDYGVIQFATLGLSLMSFSVYTAFRGVGRPTLGMWISVAGTIVNLGLDPLLIFGVGPFPELGIRGAAIASALGYFTVCLWGCIALASRKSPLRVRWFAKPGPERRDLGQILRVGLPSGISALSSSLFGSIVVKLVATYGTTVVALFGMSQNILKFGGVILAGLGLGTSALIGQYLGSRQLHRAWLSAVIGLRLGSGAMLIYAAFVFACASLLVPLFFDDPVLVEPGALYLRILCVGLPFLGLASGSEQAFAGAGKNTPPMLIHMASGWVLTVPLMILLGKTLGFGPPGLMIGNSIGQAAGALIALWLVRRGSWLEHEL